MERKFCNGARMAAAVVVDCGSFNGLLLRLGITFSGVVTEMRKWDEDHEKNVVSSGFIDADADTGCYCVWWSDNVVNKPEPASLYCIFDKEFHQSGPLKADAAVFV